MLITEFTNCFALSIREVIPIPRAEHHMHIPEDSAFPKKIAHQKPLSDNQKMYLNSAIDKLIAADIIEAICPEDMKCCSSITLAHKEHDKPSLSLNKLCHKVNEECIANGMEPAYNVELPPEGQDTRYQTKPAQLSTWRICQNYKALNRFTQVFSTPTGDIHIKQRKLSGYQWILKFNFASGSYAVYIPVTF